MLVADLVQENGNHLAGRKHELWRLEKMVSLEIRRQIQVHCLSLMTSFKTNCELVSNSKPAKREMQKLAAWEAEAKKMLEAPGNHEEGDIQESSATTCIDELMQPRPTVYYQNGNLSDMVKDPDQTIKLPLKRKLPDFLRTDSDLMSSSLLNKRPKHDNDSTLIYA